MATKYENKLRLVRDATRLIRFRYPNLAELALMPRNLGQSGTFGQLQSWIGQVYQELAQRVQDVDDAEDPDTGDDVQLDETALVAADPNLETPDYVREGVL